MTAALHNRANQPRFGKDVLAHFRRPPQVPMVLHLEGWPRRRRLARHRTFGLSLYNTKWSLAPLLSIDRNVKFGDHAHLKCSLCESQIGATKNAQNHGVRGSHAVVLHLYCHAQLTEATTLRHSCRSTRIDTRTSSWRYQNSGTVRRIECAVVAIRFLIAPANADQSTRERASGEAARRDVLAPQAHARHSPPPPSREDFDNHAG